MAFPLLRSPIAAASVVALLAGLSLGGCRVFQPESARVNKAPETFIIGAPTEHGGGYYRFHVYWYGLDVDGRVERFVWALTDATVQNPRTGDDEENQRFNPALDASTLAIGHWTTRTDSIFNFAIGAGDARAADRTLHMVAIDDFGDYDRTPARLHFFTNTLGNPELNFFRVSGPDTVAVVADVADTVGFGRPYQIVWRGRTPNLRGYSPAALALVDTIAPFDDGLLGYKWRVVGSPGEECDPTREDCWRPRKFSESTGDSFSVFGRANTLSFANDGSGVGLFGRRLPSGVVTIEVNTLDIAGVEVTASRRQYKFVVNYDPQTIILNGERDWAHPEDPELYPYYIQLNDPTRTHHPFQGGDRIPDRTYVVVKALARDDLRDAVFDAQSTIGFAGFLHGVRQNFTGGVFGFASEASALNRNPGWGAGIDGWYGDTLGFLTAPSSAFTVSMRSVDEHERRDGTPVSLTFDVGFPPCLQCLEWLPKPDFSTSGFDDSVPCVDHLDEVSTHPCLSGVTHLRVSELGDGPNDLQYYRTTTVLVNRETGFMKVTDSPTSFELALNYALPARRYKMAVLLHGRDDPREAWARPVNRIGGWQYAISYACDPHNEIADGGGIDDLRVATWGPPTPRTIDTATGVWKLEVDVAVPTLLISMGPEAYRSYVLSSVARENVSVADMIFEAVTRQFGDGWIDAVAVDQTACGHDPDRPAVFNFFRNVTVPSGLLPGFTWRDCGLRDMLGAQIKDGLPLSLGAMPSLGGQPVRKHFRLTLVTREGEYTCGAQ